MTDPDSSYRPRSPDFSSFQSFPSTFNNAYQLQPPYIASPLDQRASYDASPFFSSGYQPPVPDSRLPQQYAHQPLPYDHRFDDMARRSARISAAAQAQSEVQAQSPPPPPPQSTQQQQFIFDQHVAGITPKQEMGREYQHLNSIPPQSIDSLTEQPKPWVGIDVKTKFPVARIKRIMQADEEVGKVAQVTPIAVSKALELFMISLVTKAAAEARDRNSKRVTASHLKQAVSKDEVLDFLADICSKVPDQPSKKNEDDGSDHNEGKRKSGGGRRKKDVDSDDF